MTREEAINEIKSWDFLNEKESEAVRTLIPELRESEDERIMNWLYDMLKHGIEDAPKDCPDNPIAEKALAWLEKQKEQKYPNGCFTCDEYKKGYEAGRFHGFTAGYNKAMKEKKPRKFKLGDKVHWYDDGTNVITITGFRDDAYLTDSAYGPILFSDEDNWERIEQKPAEWSEEDEVLRQDCIRFIETGWTDNGKSHLIPWLKSLRPQLHWKPSEEQMEALERASTNEYLSAESFDILVSLYEQLKKL